MPKHQVLIAVEATPSGDRWNINSSFSDPHHLIAFLLDAARQVTLQVGARAAQGQIEQATPEQRGILLADS